MKIQGRAGAALDAAKPATARILGRASAGSDAPIDFFYAGAMAGGHEDVVLAGYVKAAEGHRRLDRPQTAAPGVIGRQPCRDNVGLRFCSTACLNEQAEVARKAVREKTRWFEFLTARG